MSNSGSTTPLAPAKPNTKAQLITAFLRKALKMIVAARSGLPGNVRNPDSSFGLRTRQLNHGDSSILEEVTWDILRCPVEIRVSLCFSSGQAAGTLSATHQPISLTCDDGSSSTGSSTINTFSEIVLEHWLVKFAGRARPTHRMDDKVLYERLSVALRSLQAVLYILPAYNFLQAQMRHVEGGSMASSVSPGIQDIRGGMDVCRCSRLGGLRSTGDGGGIGMRFERYVGVPLWMISDRSNSHNADFRMTGPQPVGILRVDLFQHNPGVPSSMAAYRDDIFAAEQLDTQTSYGPLHVSVRYRSKIVSANIETPRIINNYYMAAPKQNGRTLSSEASTETRRMRRLSEGSNSIDSVRRGSEPMPIPGNSSMHVAENMGAITSGQVVGRRQRRNTHTAMSTTGIRSVRPSSFSPPLTTGLGLLQAESMAQHHHGRHQVSQVPQQKQHRHNRHRQQQQHHHQQQQQQQQQIYGRSAPNKISWARDNFLGLNSEGIMSHPAGGSFAHHMGSPTMSPTVGSLSSNPISLVGTPPLHPHRSPSLSPNVGGHRQRPCLLEICP